MAEKSKDAAKAAKGMAKKAEGDVNLVLLCDESGSMCGNVEAVVTGVNEFVHAFKEHDAKVTLAMFDAQPGEPRCRVKYAGKRAKKVKALTAADYTPRGMTPLYDAILETLGSLEKKESAFMVILTDGKENASEATAEAVEKAIAKREKQGWAFLYLGANHDAVAGAAAIGLRKKGSAMAFTSSAKGTSSAMLRATTRGVGYVGELGDMAAYDRLAAADFDATAGVVAEDEIDSKDKAATK